MGGGGGGGVLYLKALCVESPSECDSVLGN